MAQHNNMKNIKSLDFQFKKGISFIEIIVYIAVFSAFSTGTILFGLDIINIREKATDKQFSDTSAQAAINRIEYEIKRSTGIDSITADSIILNNSDGFSTSIFLQDEIIYLQYSGSSPLGLTPSHLSVTNFVLTDLSSSTNDAKNIKIDLTIGTTNISSTYSTSIEMFNTFNESSKLLVDYTSATGSSFVNSIFISAPDALESVTLDKLYIAWAGAAGGANITSVNIQQDLAVLPLWFGSEPSGTILELSDYVISVDVVDLSLGFDSDMTGATLEVNYIMSDGSSKKTELSI